MTELNLEHISASLEYLDKVEGKLNPVILEILKENLEATVDDVAIGGGDSKVYEIIPLIFSMFESEDGEVGDQIVGYLTSLASQLNTGLRTKVIKAAIDEGDYSRLYVESSTQEIEGDIVHKPAYLYTVGLSKKVGFELVVSNNAPSEYLDRILMGALSKLDELTEKDVDWKVTVNEGNVWTIENFFKIADGKELPVSVKKVDLAAAVRSHTPFLLEPELDLGEDFSLLQVFVPDPNGAFPYEDEYDKSYGQELIA